MAKPIRVLCVDDDPHVADLTAAFLERRTEPFEIETSTSATAAVDRFEKGGADCLVSDYEMPGMDGLDLLDAVREQDPDIPFVLFTGNGSETIASDAISAGVTDYVQKGTGTDQYEVLANRIENAVSSRRAEQARRESERELKQYRTLVQQVGDPMYALDETGTLTMINRAMAEWTGWDPEAVVGTHITEHLDDETIDRGRETLLSLLDKKRDRARFEFTFETEAGSERVGEAHMTPLTEDDGWMNGSVGVVRDITERKARERELVQYERIVETAPIGMFVLDAEGRVAWMNREFVDGFAESEETLQDLPFVNLIERGYFEPETVPEYFEMVRRLLSSETDDSKVVHTELFYPADGEKRIYEVHTSLLPLSDGEFAGTVKAFRDITKRTRYERELERQNDRLEEFASLVSHDLRNPLSVAQGHVDLLEDETDSDSVDEIRWALTRMEVFIEDLLTLARQGRMVGERESAPVSQLVEEAWNAVDTADATLDRSATGTISVDSGRVCELFENLFRNAVQHGRADATITVGLLGDDGTLSPEIATDAVGLFVEDDGPGFDDEATVFEVGYTTHEAGTGFGLAIVDRIAEAHGWTVTARTGTDGGARVELRGIEFSRS